MLRKFVAPELVFGPGAIEHLPRSVQALGGRRVLVVSDPGVTAAGWLDRTLDLLGGLGPAPVVFREVSPNPRMAQVMAGVELYRREQCDVIVAIGGGSPMDCAKGIAVVASNGGHVRDYEGVDRISRPMPPLICIPTTAGTSADVSQFAIINNEAERYKFAIISKAVIPDLSLVDPDLTVTMSPFLAACTGVDALVHAIEAFVSTGAGPLTDSYALDAIRLIAAHVPGVIDGSGGAEARERVAEASLKAGLAFSNAILGAVHAMAHSLGGYLDLPHGQCNALLLPAVVDYNFTACPERYRAVGQALGLSVLGMPDGQLHRRLVDYLHAFIADLGIRGGLSDAGVKSDDANVLAERAAKDPCLLTNPRSASSADLAALYREAL